ncbi:dTMP kinase [Candidatus Berkelbacteria bacterium]|nr:dTMP kinase [Candidatus Berkelbacteria bacterium]
MVRHDHPGLFIAVEGLDGSGSSHFAAVLAHSLETSGYRVFLTREPTRSLVGGLILARLHGEWQADAEALQLLFTADRALHLEKEILPALEAGKIVITDRYAFSAIAYGAVEVGDPEWLKHLNGRFILPDLTFLVQVSPKICALRIKETHYEAELYTEEKKLQRVWNGYAALAEEYPGVTIIQGERTDLEIIQEMKEKTLRTLSDAAAKDNPAFIAQEI